MVYRAAQLSFSKGMVSPEIEARFDISVYNAGCREATNFRILKTGGLTKRMGLQYVAEALSSSSRLLPFQFGNTQGYALEFAQAAMRVNALGGQVLEAGLSISNITNASSATVTVAFHGWAVGDQIYFDAVEGMTEINGLIGTVLTVPDENTVTIDIDTTTFGTFSGSGGGTVNTEPPPPPPPPPTVPPPADPPPISDTSGPCVSDDTPILMEDGTEKPAGEIEVGDFVWTRHEITNAWCARRVTHVQRVLQPVRRCWLPFWRQSIRATPNHRFRLWSSLLGKRAPWIKAKWIGIPCGLAWVMKITVEDAHTYVSAGVLSHNIKPIQLDERGGFFF